MAHMFPDCVGEVDVVSDAENIKKLLKIPYHKGHISMMVHRIENTLLIDDFDIYKHLLKTAETEWEWLKKFFFENINRATYEEDKHMFIQSRRREALKEKNLVSKFLYHSLVTTDSAEASSSTNLIQTTRTHPLQGPALPEPAPQTKVPDAPTGNHDFNRNVVWTFEDIEMLIGGFLHLKYKTIILNIYEAYQVVNIKSRYFKKLLRYSCQFGNSIENLQ